MALIHCNFYSQELFCGTDLNVIVPSPDSGEVSANADLRYFHPGAKFKVLYLLHGAFGDYSDWARLTSIERYAQEKHLVVVMPSAGNSFYQNMLHYITDSYFLIIRTYMSPQLSYYYIY